ncbi:cofilin [Choiromyces venosus 120613-1]|uniref:Cofilin n=1 Tax=Choiromyces venosus 120613-1 TaxID=1336337 RepID=A0A3N4JMY3_9PEZI|nr:cofilin [Choiromyces venosus 120613-1]
MSRSGVTLAQDIISSYQEFKLGKKHAYVLYKLSEDNKVIEVEKKVLKDDKPNPKDQYEEFIAALPEKQCRYAIYDFTYDLPGEGTRDKIIFFAWSPDNASIKQKMICASSKGTLRSALTGVAAEIQGTDYSEIAYEVVFQKVARTQST